MPHLFSIRTLTNGAGSGLIFTLVCLGAVSANQAHSLIRPPMKPFHAASAHRHRLTNGASCDGGSQGFNAFDAGTTFTTNNVTSFGDTNLANAQDSGVFEGSENSVCDLYSAIGGGETNIVDSGDGETPSGAENSFIGAGSFNAVSNEDAFDGAGEENFVTGPWAFNGAGYGNAVSGLYAFIGAGLDNQVSGAYSGSAAGYSNQVSDMESFVGAGYSNQVTSSRSFIGAGNTNTVSNDFAFVGAGYSNTVSGEGSFIGAGGVFSGKRPYNQVSGNDSFLGAGDENSISTNDSFIGAGVLNNMTSAANESVIVGGYGNTMSGQKASLGGGEYNNVAGSFATIPGGYRNEALGNESFAAGSQAEARYTGSFVWSDYVAGERPQGDSAAGEFVARASGGVYFFSNAASSTGVHLAAGSGTWSSLSDRNSKTAIVPLDDASILAKVANLPISAWRYKTEHGVRHVGPMAQDFYAAFGVGEDDRHITSIDEDGVALAAIKALHSENRQLRSDGERKSAEIAQLRASVETLASKDAALERRMDLVVAHFQSHR